jgi:hypothetical protein
MKKIAAAIPSDTFEIFYLLRLGQNQFSFFLFYQNLCLSWNFFLRALREIFYSLSPENCRRKTEKFMRKDVSGRKERGIER